MGLSVLVIEDEAEIRHNLEAYLQDEGMATTGVECCEDALHLLASGRRFNVCVVDVRLNGMGGDQGVPKLHALQRDLRFIIHTGSSDFRPPSALRAVGISDQDVFRKPIPDMGVLADAVRRAASGGARAPY